MSEKEPRALIDVPGHNVSFERNFARPSDESLAKLIDEAHGNVSAIARAIGRSRHTVRHWIEESDQLSIALAEAREARVDFAESVVWEHMRSGTLNAAFFVLNNAKEAKERGWGARVELTGRDGGSIEVGHKLSVEEKQEEFNTLMDEWAKENE